MSRLLSFSFALVLLSACGGGGRSTLPTGPSPVTAKIAFSIVSSTPGAATIVECAEQMLVHPSWWGFAQVAMVPIEAEAWAILFEDVPIGHHSVRLRAPSSCGELHLAANGAWLTDQVGGGPQTAFRFVLHADGSVSP